MKPLLPTYYNTLITVAPTTGAWIETLVAHFEDWKEYVAPTTGAWIETNPDEDGDGHPESLPPRERGLKLALMLLVMLNH